MEKMEWEKWCRLCGKSNGSDVDAMLKLKNTETLAENIRKYFGILISDSDICTKICNECNNTISSIVKYNSQVLKVNGMFLELEKSYLNENINLSSLRKKHGLNNKINGLSDSELHETDVGLVKADVKSTILNKSSTAVKVKPCKVIVSNKNVSFKSKLKNNSTIKQTETDESIKHPNENSSLVFPFGLNDLDKVNLRCRYCNKKFHKKDCLIKHTGNHFNYILTCNICKKHFCTKYKILRHKTIHLTHVKSKSFNNSPPPLDVKSCKVIEYNDMSSTSKPEDNSTTKQTEIDEAIEPPNENFSVVFPFGLNDLDEVNLRCRYCNKKFHKKDSLIEHTENHFNYILTCNICKKHFSTKTSTQCHKTTHLTHVKSKSFNNSLPPVDVNSCKVIKYNDISFKSKSEDNLTTKQTEIGKVITHSTDVKSKPLNNSLPPPCVLEMEIGDVTDVDLENLLSSSESNDELPLAHVKSKTLNNSPPPVDVKSCKVIEYIDISFKDNSTIKQTETDESIKHPNENSSLVFPFGLNDLDEVNLRCRYCNKKFHKKDCLIKHTRNHFNYILTCNICKKHFCTKYKILRHKTIHLTHVKSKSFNNSPPPVDVKSCKVIEYNDMSSTSKPEDNSTTKQTEIGKVITHSTDVKSKPLNNSLPPPCVLEMEIGDVTDVDLENLLSSSESNDELPLAHVKSKTLNNSPPPVDVKSCKVIEYNDISFKSKPEDNSTTKQTEINEAIEPPNESFSVVFPFGLNDLDEVNLRCRYCNKKFHKKDSLIEHTENHFNYILTCNICKKHFFTKASTQCHKTTHLTHVKSKLFNNSPPPVDVNSCKVIKYSDISLKSKSEDNSTTKQTEIDEAIEPPNENSSVVFPFGINDLDEVNLWCRYCNMKFHKKDSLIKHTGNHFNYILTCNICKKHFSTKQCTQRHKTTHLTNENEMQQQTNIKQGGDDNLNLNQEAEIPSEKEKFFACNICQKRFTFRGRTKHMRKHFANKDIAQNPFPFQCRVCGKSCKNLNKLRSHEAVHLPENERKSYECSYCKKKYKAECVLKYHITFVHKKDGSFMCEFCGEAFPTNKILRCHMFSHSKEKKFKCSKCEKTFKRATSLKVHMDSHEGIKYPCQICGLKLNTRKTLRTHMIVHSDVNKYKCNICSKQYKRWEQFKLHLIAHLKMKPYECLICNSTFGSQTSCRLHQRNIHPVELAAAELTDKPKMARNVPSMKSLYEFNEKALCK